MNNNTDLENQNIKNILALMKEKNITVSDVSKAAASQGSKNKKQLYGFSIISLYIACTLLFSGVWMFIQNYWSSLNSVFRVFLTYGIGEFFFVASMLWYQKERRKNNGDLFIYFINPLLVLSIPLKIIGFAVFAKEMYPNGDDLFLLSFFISIILLLQIALALRKAPSTILVFFGLCLMSVVWYSSYFLILRDSSMAIMIFHYLKNDIGKIVGVEIVFLYILLCTFAMNVILWCVQKSPYKSISGFGFFINMLVFFITGAILLSIVDLKIFFALFILIGFGNFYILKNKMILLVTILASFGYITYLTIEYFVGNLTWPIILVGMGGVMIASFFLQKKTVPNNCG